MDVQAYAGYAYDGVKLLAAQPPVMDFVTDMHRHGKTLLVLSASALLLDRAGIDTLLASGEPDPGLLLAPDATDDHTQDKAASDFIAALGRHRHPEREAPAVQTPLTAP